MRTTSPARTRSAPTSETATAANGKINVTISSWTAGGNDYTIDDAKTYDLIVQTTNAWGNSGWKWAPLIHPNSVSNLANAVAGDSDIQRTSEKAIAFTTGANPGGYTLKSITAKLKKKGTPSGNLRARLRPMQGSGPYTKDSEPSQHDPRHLVGDAAGQHQLDRHGLHLFGQRLPARCQYHLLHRLRQR